MIAYAHGADLIGAVFLLALFVAGAAFGSKVAR